MALSPGTRLGSYEILSALGAGGMGEVYRANDAKLGREVAVKVLPESVSSDPERLARFEREARALASLNHPNIVTVYSVEEAGGVRLLTMELVDGETLDRAIPAGGLPLSRFFEIAMPLAEALSAAHERGIVHRDLKPANVMLTHQGRLKVLDFGLAKLVDVDSDPQVTGLPTESHVPLTSEGKVFGTVAYMSPEQARGGKLDPRSDVFSLGVVFYELLTGERPFKGASSVDVISAILRDSPSPVTEVRADLPPYVGRILRRCLAKDPHDRYQTSRDVFNELRDLKAETPAAPAGREATPSGPRAAVREDEGFWIAVLPFKCSGRSAELTHLAEGLTEDIVAGLSRFTYLRVRSAGTELGARYVMEGSLRQAGTRLRLAVQLVDTSSGAHLWAETYERAFDPEAVFELLDDLVPRVVATCGDRFGVLARNISDAVRGGDPARLEPYEALMRAFGYHHRLTPVEHAEARQVLERAVERAPTNADCWAMLSWIYSHEHAHGFNVRPGSLDRALAAARRAVDLAPSNQLAQQALAVVSFFRKETVACLSAAERAIALNPLDTSNEAMYLIAFTGDWERGYSLIRRAMERNPNHPRWYETTLGINEYHLKNYRGTVDAVVKANAPDIFWTHLLLAAAYGQLGELGAARQAVRDLLAQKPDFAESAPQFVAKWFDPQMVDHLMEGLRKAGLGVAASGEAVAIAVLPFSDMSPAKDQEYLCEGMAEEIMNALVRVDGIRVASRTSAFRARHEGGDLPSIARALSVNHVLEGSVRTSGSRLRVTAQLTDVATGYQLWSERFDREAADVFAVQDEIAAGVVEAVRARLAPGARIVPARPKPRDLEAYRSYLKGRHLRYAKEDAVGAIQAFEEAVRLDPSHAPSWTGLAESNALAAALGAIPAREACAAARRAVAKAVALQGETADSLHGEAWLALMERRWPAMETAWRRAIELQPTHALALGSFGISLCMLGKQDEGFRLLERAREVDPLASFPYMLTSYGLLFFGRAEEAHRYAEDALSFEKEDASALVISAMANIALGRFEDAIATSEHLVALSHGAPFFRGVLGWALASAGRKDEARKIAEELRAGAEGTPTAVSEAWLLGALGESDAAFAVLARAEEEHQMYLCFAGLPGFDPLRADPRFGALLARLGLPASFGGKR